MASEGASDNQSTEAHVPSTQVRCEEQVSSAEKCEGIIVDYTLCSV